MFLCVVDSLNRLMMNNDTNIPGIKIRLHVHKLSNYADGRSIFLSSLTVVEYLFDGSLTIYMRA